MVIDVFADVVCPWCYIGERRLEQALSQRPELQVVRRWRPFQLQPGMPKTGMPWDEFARRKFGGLQRAQAAFGQVVTAGAADGLTFNFDRVVSAPNTVDAHRLILFAARFDRQWEMVEALFAAYFTHGRNLNNHDHLTEVATEVGLAAESVRVFLASDDQVDAVTSSQEEAGQLGIQGVPFFVIDERYALSGAQPLPMFLRALDMVTQEMAEGAASL